MVLPNLLQGPERTARGGRMTRTVLTKSGKPRTLTPENCTRDGLRWGFGIGWDDMEWAEAWFDGSAIFGPHIKVPHKNGDTVHRIRGKRWKIAGPAAVTLERAEQIAE
jgi:hypothetical protein